jgi:hypothetical protein
MKARFNIGPPGWMEPERIKELREMGYQIVAFEDSNMKVGELPAWEVQQEGQRLTVRWKHGPHYGGYSVDLAASVTAMGIAAKLRELATAVEKMDGEVSARAPESRWAEERFKEQADAKKAPRPRQS